MRGVEYNDSSIVISKRKLETFIYYAKKEANYPCSARSQHTFNINNNNMILQSVVKREICLMTALNV